MSCVCRRVLFVGVAGMGVGAGAGNNVSNVAQPYAGIDGARERLLLLGVEGGTDFSLLLCGVAGGGRSKPIFASTFTLIRKAFS